MAFSKKKLESELRKSKQELNRLRNMCRRIGLPLLVIYLPELVNKGKNLTPGEKKWSRAKRKEYLQLKKSKQL